MTDRPAVDRLVTDWLRDAAPAHASEGTLAVAMERVAASGQDRHVTQRLFGDELGRSTGLRRSLALGLVALGLIGAVAVAGALIPRPPAPTGTPSNGWVAYSVAGDIVIARPGEAPRVVISQEGDAIDQTCPRFSPDGASLAYIEQPAFAQEGDPRNLVLTGEAAAADGSARRIAVESFADTCPAWSPDGSRLAMLERGAIVSLYVIGLDGTASVRFRRDDSGSNPEQSPFGGFQDATFAWSPDGSRLALLIGYFPGASEIWIVPADAGEPRRILAGAPDLEIFRSIAWSPDGSEIAYRGHTYTENQEGAPETPRRHFVRRIAVDGASAPVELDTWTETKDVSSAGPAWSPDGGRMAYERNGEIVVGSADGSASRPLPTVRLVPPEDDPWEADGTWWPGALSWSPDGRRLISLGTSMPFLGLGVASSIVSVDADGAGAPEILTPWRLAYYADRAPSWQPVLETVPAWDPDARGVDDLGPLATRAPNPVPTPTPPPQPASDE
jgi:Tol biopolymer transport system component